MNNLAAVHQEQGKLQEAEDLHMLEARRRALLSSMNSGKVLKFSSLAGLTESLKTQGFARVDSGVMRELLVEFGAQASDLENYPKHWSHLGDDPVYPWRKTSHMPVLFEKKIQQQPHAPFKLSYGDNAELGDMERKFPEASREFATDTVTSAIVRLMRSLLRHFQNDSRGKIRGLHQIRAISRVEGGPNHTQKDSPPPERVHQDGAELVTVTFVGGEHKDCRAGESRIYGVEQPAGIWESEESEIQAACKTRLCEHTMPIPFEAIILNDRCVKHDNLVLKALDGSKEARRDVLFMWAREPNADGLKTPCEKHTSAPVKMTDFLDQALSQLTFQDQLLDPKDAKKFLGPGDSKRTMGNHEAAIKDFDGAIELTPVSIGHEKAGRC